MLRLFCAHKTTSCKLGPLYFQYIQQLIQEYMFKFLKKKDASKSWEA